MQTDIFEIKTASIEFKIGDNRFKVRDPKFLDKVNIKKAWDDLSKKKNELSETDYLGKVYDLNKLTIKAYIPEMTDDYIDNQLPSSALNVLIQKITEIAQDSFGAVVEKTEKK